MGIAVLPYHLMQASSVSLGANPRVFSQSDAHPGLLSWALVAKSTSSFSGSILLLLLLPCPSLPLPLLILSSPWIFQMSAHPLPFTSGTVPCPPQHVGTPHVCKHTLCLTTVVLVVQPHAGCQSYLTSTRCPPHDITHTCSSTHILTYAHIYKHTSFHLSSALLGKEFALPNKAT